MTTIKSKTEKFLLSIAIVLSLGLFVTAVSVNYADPVSAVEEGSESNDEKSESSSDEKSEASSSDEKSESSSDEKSEASSNDEKSEASSDDNGLSEAELSEKSSTESAEMSEKSEVSVKSIDGFDEVVSVEGNVAIVKKGERLFFLVPIEIEFEVTLDEQGNVISERQSFWSKLLSLLSY